MTEHNYLYLWLVKDAFMTQKILFCSISLLLTSMLFNNCTKEEPGTPIYPENCANYLVGTYSGTDYCSASGQTPYSCSIIASTPVNITISHLGGVTVNAILDCEKNTLTIPAQTFAGNFTITGSGTYTANRIVINWSGVSSGIPMNCNTTYTR